MAYDVAAAFEQIENELISSMMRNFKRHRAEETAQGYNWTQWQAEQLAALEEYRQSNSKRFGEQFSRINGKVEEMLRKARESGAADQEASILSAIKKGYTPRPHRNSVPVGAEFFKINDGKMNALLNATTHDLEKAEHAVLRRANDSYRKIIFNAQVFANSGAGTYEKAVDMATRDFLRAGINSIVYKNGARHTISDYADMAIKTANTRARLMGEGEKRREWGETLVVVRHKRGCAKCARHIGHVYIDDIFSGGTKSDGDYPLLSDAVKDGLLHPRCNISLTTYREGITPKRRATEEEIAEFERRERIEERQAYHEREAEKNQRIADNSLDPGNKKTYAHRAEQHRKKAAQIAEKAVANSGESGIISEGSKNPITLITDEAISKIPIVKISGYTDDQCTEFRKQHQELLRFARDKNNHQEVAFVFRSDLTDRHIFTGSDDEISFSTSSLGRDCVVLHNHPRNSSFSLNDIIEFLSNDFIKTITIVKNSGMVETLTKTALFNRNQLLLELSRMEKKTVKRNLDSEYRRLIEKFLLKHSGGAFEWKK